MYSNTLGVCATVVWFPPPHCSSQCWGRGERERLATSGLNGVCYFGIWLLVILLLGYFVICHFVILLHCYLVESKKAYVAFMIARALD